MSRALETSQFHIASATALLAQNPIAVLHVATVLAHRVDGANHALIQLKNQLQTGQAHSAIAKMVSRWRAFSPLVMSSLRTESVIDHAGPKARRIAVNIAKLPELLKKE